MNEPTPEEIGLKPNSPETKTDEERKLQLIEQESIDLKNQIDHSEGKTPEEIEELQRQFEEKKADQRGAEKDFLGTSQIMTQNPETRQSNIPTPEQTETELKEEREKFVREYINSVIENFVSHWQSDLSASANGERATRLIALKTESTIMDKAKSFIEQGGQPNFGGGEGRLELSYFDGPDGQRVQYVTGFELRSLGGVETVQESEITREDEEAQEELREAEEQGELLSKEI